MKTLLIIVVFLSFTLTALGQGDSSVTLKKNLATKESVAIAEIGGATSWNLKGGGLYLSPTIAVEVTPIEEWLELEAGVTPTFTAHSTEWDIDLLFKKPWTLSPKVEFMAGTGPVLIHIITAGAVTNSLGGELALDFMFWPFAKHKFGWYLEPGYQCNFGQGHEQSVGVSGGLLVSIP